MKKIKTIFDRDWDGNCGVVDKLLVDTEVLVNPTEKLDGTNVRITVRNHSVMRLEKRRNPTKVEKKKGITDPWYVDADMYDAQDKYLWEAVKGTDLSDIEDGEWSGEAIGEKIQGNPLGIDGHTIILFSCGRAPALENVPVDFEELKEWIPLQTSKVGKGGIEGIVWDGKYKIKGKDFKKSP